MKAVIFSCSLKNPKYSTTRAWSELLAKRLALKGIDSQVINLRDYDYEASTDRDELHEQLKHVYDASLIIFASPSNIYNPTFSCTNLVERFVHAYKKSSKEKVNIFKNKVWEYCQFQSLEYTPIKDLGAEFKGYFKKDVQKEERAYYHWQKLHPHWENHHGRIMKMLGFIEHLGLVDTHVNTYAPPNGYDGPNYHDIEEHNRPVEVCDSIIDAFNKKGHPTKDATPNCSLEKFLKFFQADESHAFGRGMTIADENINEKSVKENIRHVHRHMSNVSQKAMIFISMKERCTRLGLLDLAEQYYIQHFYIQRGEPKFQTWCSGNWRPNGY